ncbi:hypothetical protein [Parasulfitobacter algicola]|uniref:Membrane-associated oxidoreductase n=1 Tax=Parasulfitobacter algicola TaxID=2614809 RepID=A0ABX2IMX5_9RHOB|nr:hypothetical protein [Sulfitobacter algicola]NSX54242.1 hypothetical protein [Sulfitobacter algicola]
MPLIENHAPLSLAEERLVAECSGPSRITIGDGERPIEASQDRAIRADVIRAILLNEDPSFRLHDKGLRLRGAWITGALDLQGCDLEHDITLTQCHLDSDISLVNTRLRGLHISGCLLKGMAADNASFAGSLYLRSETRIEGEISLAGARINGDLQICAAHIEAPGQDAVFAPSLRVDGSVFLGNYPYSDGITSLVAVGTLFFSSARVAHDFFVSNTSVSLKESVIGEGVFSATEEHGRDMALSLARAQVGGILFFQDNQISRGIVNLAGASVDKLKDEPEGPGAGYPLRLDGFRYNDFSRHTKTGVDTRLAWLERRPADMPFTAQPYEQLAHVMQQLGHRNDARLVLMHKERLLRRENRLLLRQENGRGIRWALMGLTDTLLRLTVGYGYRPGRAVLFAFVLIMGLGLFYQKTWDAGDMTPNAAPILVSKDWITATQLHSDNPGAFWSQPGQAGQDWETFNAFAYSADLVIPLISLGQENAWAPSTSRSPWGRAGWWMRWFAKTLGWIITALAAAALTGLIRQD